MFLRIEKENIEPMALEIIEVILILTEEESIKYVKKLSAYDLAIHLLGIVKKHAKELENEPAQA